MASTSESVNQLEKHIKGLALQETQAGEQRKKAVEYINRDRRKREDLERRLQEMEKAAGQQDDKQTGRCDNRFHFLSGPNNPPKFPTSPGKVANWEQRMTLFLESQGLGYTIRHSTNPVPIIGYVDPAGLVYRYGEQCLTMRRVGVSC